MLVHTKKAPINEHNKHPDPSTPVNKTDRVLRSQGKPDAMDEEGAELKPPPSILKSKKTIKSPDKKKQWKASRGRSVEVKDSRARSATPTLQTRNTRRNSKN